jgi:fluoride ion exporter CrcB/FEX
MVVQLAAEDSEAVMRGVGGVGEGGAGTNASCQGGTWTIDLTGSFLLGVLIGCAEPVHLHPLLIAAVGTGFLGA